MFNNISQEDKKIVFEEIERLRVAAGGFISAEKVLESATNPHSPLHQYLEWDNEKAAFKWRIHQVHQLIKIVVVKSTDDTPRRYHVKVQRNNEQVYTTRPTVMNQDALRRQQVRRSAGQLRGWLTQFGDYPELEAQVAAIKEVLKLYDEAVWDLREDFRDAAQ